MNVDQSSGSTAHPMEFLLAQEFDLIIPQVGDTLNGIIVNCSGNQILVDVGAKSEGLIHTREVDNMDQRTRDKLIVGEEVAVQVIEIDDKNGQLIFSYEKAASEQDWLHAADLLEKNETFETNITDSNRGGLLARIGAVRAFIPASQLVNPPPDRNAPEAYLRQYVGKPLTIKVIEVDKDRNRLILSERAASRKKREAAKSKLLEALSEGQICDGTVVNLESFGAFVDIGGLQGLVHLSELSWKRVTHPSDELSLGDRVQVFVLNVDHNRQRVALSIKRLQPDPWEEIETIYQQDQLVEVVITKLERYGAFARLNDEYGLEGLIHVSELSEERIKHPSEILASGDILGARIIRIDKDQRQLGLSLKQALSAEYIQQDLEGINSSE